VAPEFDGMELRCNVETTDGSAHDEMFMSMVVDDVDMAVFGAITKVKIDDFKEGYELPAEQKLSFFTSGVPVRYIQSVWLGLHEQDTNSCQYGTRQVTILPRSIFSAGSAQTLGTASWDPDEGHSFMSFLRSRGTQELE
jgi:hypothetical protein